MKFICDEMLKGLARWLRAAGYDTETAIDGEKDRILINRAHSTGRILVTRDRKLMEFRNAEETVCLIHCSGISDCARDLKKQTGLDWLYKPFTRCLLCNTELVSIEYNEGLDVPDDVRHGVLYRCNSCQRIYWAGSHVRRMLAKLEAWANMEV
jgi:uncharacterized protein with PIN domain